MGMQSEIKSLINAMFTEQKRETELINDILMAIAVGGCARRKMLQDIAAAVTRGDDFVLANDKLTTRSLEDELADLNIAIDALRSKVA